MLVAVCDCAGACVRRRSFLTINAVGYLLAQTAHRF